jgi:hypothetical protein
MDDPVIINGPHVGGQPLGSLTGPNGEIIDIWSYEPADLLNAMSRATGPVPRPEPLGLGGHVEVVEANPFQGTSAQVIYNPAGDETNAAAANEYASLIQGYNARAQAVSAVIVAILERKAQSQI